jgi:hypothetical protein
LLLVYKDSFATDTARGFRIADSIFVLMSIIDKKYYLKRSFPMVACAAMLMLGYGATVRPNGGIGAPGVIHNTVQPWLDTRGHALNAHGAGMMFYKGDYYLYGEIKNSPTWLVSGQSWDCYRVKAVGISCYSSADLVHWRYRGVALAAVEDSSSDLDTGRVIERPKVIFNSRTRKFVMWMHVDDRTYHYARAGVAMSENPEGPFHYLGSFRPDGAECRDLTLFEDEDARAYLIFSSEHNTAMHVQPLTADYLRPAPGYHRILTGLKREAPAVFSFHHKYYMITSLCSGWDPNAAAWAMADSMMGDWKQQGNPCRGRDSEVTYSAQSAYVQPILGKPGTFLFAADRWNKTNLAVSRYLWLPLSITQGKPVIRWKASWQPL